jgi:2-methylaconitate cis-trans-isomerase PrpF
MLIWAADLGKSGFEASNSYGADPGFMAQLESLQVEAGRRMVFPNAADLVIPKPVLIAAATSCVTPGTIAAI